MNFADHIAEHGNAETVPVELTRLETDSGSTLDVRRRGCYITRLALVHPKTGEKHTIMQATNLHEPKLNATHIMFPVGPSNEIGGPHGYSRWADFHEFRQTLPDNEAGYVALQAKRSDMGVGVNKSFALTASSVTMETTLANNEAEPVATSLGEHLYFHLENGAIDGLTVNGKTLDELLGPGAGKQILEGIPLYWHGFAGLARIDFPAGHEVIISSEVTSEAASETAVGMLIWHREHSDTICFEPVIGYRSHEDNLRLIVPGHESVSLMTSIMLREEFDSDAE